MVEPCKHTEISLSFIFHSSIALTFWRIQSPMGFYSHPLLTNLQLSYRPCGLSYRTSPFSKTSKMNGFPSICILANSSGVYPAGSRGSPTLRSSNTFIPSSSSCLKSATTTIPTSEPSFTSPLAKEPKSIMAFGSSSSITLSLYSFFSKLPRFFQYQLCIV